MERTIPEDDQGLRQRVEDLTDQVMTLRSRIEELAIQIGDLSGGPNPGAVPQYGENLAALAPVGHERPKASTLLSTTAAVSFLLVIALVLRTASDNGIINLQFGAFMGLLYGFGLFLFDYVRYSRMRRPIPIYAICGGILVFAIDIENRALFEEIFPPLTYIILAAVLLALVALGINLSLPSLVCVGTIGASAAGVSLGFPDLNFPLAAGLLLLANVGAYIGTRLPRCQWMPGGMLVITMFFWLVWSVKLCHALDQDLVHVESYALPWFLPALAVFMVWYLYLPVVKALRDGNSQAKGEAALPVVTVAWAYPVWRCVFVASHGQVDVAGRVGIAVAITFMVLALWLFHQSVLGRHTAVSFLLGC